VAVQVNCKEDCGEIAYPPAMFDAQVIVLLVGAELQPDEIQFQFAGEVCEIPVRLKAGLTVIDTRAIEYGDPAASLLNMLRAKSCLPVPWT
jgi:hypothetical protein